MLAELSMTHAFLPPHPGPVAAAGLLGVDLGWIIMMGLICGIPAWLVSGVWWGSYIGKRVLVDVPDEFVSAEPDVSDTDDTNVMQGGGGTRTAVRTRPRRSP